MTGAAVNKNSPAFGDFADECEKFVQGGMWARINVDGTLDKTVLLCYDPSSSIGLLGKLLNGKEGTPNPSGPFMFDHAIEDLLDDLAETGTFGVLRYWVEDGTFMLVTFVYIDQASNKEFFTGYRGELTAGAEWEDIEGFIPGGEADGHMIESTPEDRAK